MSLMNRKLIQLAVASTVAAGIAGDSGVTIFGAAPRGPESIMDDKGGDLGSCVAEVQHHLRWGCIRATNVGAVHVACHNRHFAEYRGYWKTTDFPAAAAAAKAAGTKINFYDSVTGKVRGSSFA